MTQFFLRDTASDLGGAGQKALATSRGAASTTAVTNTTASGTNIQVTKTAAGQALTWFSPPLNAVTISGSVTVNIRGLDSVATVNAGAGILIERCNGSGTVLSSIVADTTVPAVITSYTTTDAAKTASFTPTSTALSDGDRIKVTLKVRNSGTMAVGTVTNSYDGPTSAAAGDTFVTFTEDVDPFVSGGVRFDSSPTAVGFTTSPGTWSHTNNGNGILVAVTTFTGSTNTTTGVTYGGVSVPFLTFIQSGAGGGGGVALYALVGASCPTGTNTVSVAVSDPANNHNAGSITVKNAGSLGTPVTSAVASAASKSITVTNTTTGGLVVSVTCQGGAGNFSATSPNFLKFQHLGTVNSSSDNIAGGTIPSPGGGASVTASWTNTATDDWGMIAVEVIPSTTVVSPPVSIPRRSQKPAIAATRAPRSRQNSDVPVPPNPSVLDALGPTRRLKKPSPYYFTSYRQRGTAEAPTPPPAVIASPFIWDAPRFPVRFTAQLPHRIHGQAITGWPVPVQPPNIPYSLRRDSRPLFPRRGVVEPTGWPVPVQPAELPHSVRRLSKPLYPRRGTVPPSGLPVPVQPPEVPHSIRRYTRPLWPKRGNIPLTGLGSPPVIGPVPIRSERRHLRPPWPRRGNAEPNSGLPVAVQPPERMQSVRRTSRPLWPRRGVTLNVTPPPVVTNPSISFSERRWIRPPWPRRGTVSPTGWPVKVQPAERMQSVRRIGVSPSRVRGRVVSAPVPPAQVVVSNPYVSQPTVRRKQLNRKRTGFVSSGAIPSEPSVTTFRLTDGVNGRPGIGSSVLTPPASPINYTGNFEAGLFFAVLGGGYWFDGYWWYVPVGGDTSPQKFCLYTISGTGAGQQQIVPGSTVISGTLTAGAMNFIPLPVKIPLSVGITGSAAGGLYGAMTAWPAQHGFPDSAGQMGALYPNGIRNGPLVTFGINGPSRGIGQGSTFGVATTDPTTAVAFGVSSNDFFWLDVQISSTPPANFVGPYRLYPNRLDWNAVGAADSSVNYGVATEIHVSRAMVLTAMSYYSPPGTTQLATEVGVYTIDGPNAGTRLVLNSSPVWSGAAGSGWVRTTIPPVTIPVGAYKFYVYNNSATPDGWSAKDANSAYWKYGEGANGIEWDPIFAPPTEKASPAYEYDGSAGGSTPKFTTGVIEPGQSTFSQLAPGTPTSTYPYLYVTGLYQNYWIDAEFMEVSTAPPGTPTLARRIARQRRSATARVAAVPPNLIAPVKQFVRKPLKRTARSVQPIQQIPGPIPPVERQVRYRKFIRYSRTAPGVLSPPPVNPFNPRSVVRPLKLRLFRRSRPVSITGLPVKVQPPERMQSVRRWIRPLLPRRGVTPGTARPLFVPKLVSLPSWVWIDSELPNSEIITSFPFGYISIILPDTTITIAAPIVSITVVIPLEQEKED